MSRPNTVPLPSTCLRQFQQRVLRNGSTGCVLPQVKEAEDGDRSRLAGYTLAPGGEKRHNGDFQSRMRLGAC